MSLIPNSFQYPNYYNDILDQYLTPEESKVLTRAIREIFGWEEHRQTRTAQISISSFLNGNPRNKSAGIGLNRETIIAALDALHTYRILLKIGKAHDSRGQTYKLNLDETTIDFDGLKQRLLKRQLANKQRTATARTTHKNKESRLSDKTSAGLSDKTSAGLSDKTSAGLSDKTSAGLSDKTSAGLSDKTSAGLSDRPTERYIKKEKENEISSSTASIESAPKDAAVDDVAAINSIFHSFKRQERLTPPLLAQIVSIHALESPAEVLLAVRALAPQAHIRSVIAVLKGKRTPDGYESGCFDGGKCYLYAPDDAPTRPQPNEPDAAPRLTAAELRERIAAMDAATRERVRRKIEARLESHRAQMKPSVYADTLKYAMETELEAIAANSGAKNA